jgi:MFS family permease
VDHEDVQRMGQSREGGDRKGYDMDSMPAPAALGKVMAWGGIGVLLVVLACRMMGVFIAYPVLATHAHELVGSNTARVGLALGAYGLTQALCTLPLAMLSDRFGRKPVIGCGLLMLGLGSVMAAQAHHIGTLIAARAVQGSGAVGASLMAALADLSPANARTMVMAGVGMVMAVSFALAFLLGPILAAHGGLAPVFWFTAALSAAALLALLVAVPQRPAGVARRTVGSLLGRVFMGLWPLHVGIAMLHISLAAIFLVLPGILHETAPHLHSAVLYGSSLLASFLISMAGIALAERARRTTLLAGCAVAALCIGCLLLAWHRDLTILVVGMVVYFSGFNALEALLPSLTSRRAPEPAVGTAMGVFSTFQFLGIFLGGSLGGLVAAHGSWLLLGSMALLPLLWFAAGQKGLAIPERGG